MDEIALISVGDAMRTLGVGRTKFYQLAGAGKIELVHIGKKALATKASLTAFVAALPRGVSKPSRGAPRAEAA